MLKFNLLQTLRATILFCSILGYGCEHIWAQELIDQATTILEQSKEFRYSKPDTAMILAQKATEFARQNKNSAVEAACLRNIGILYKNQEDFTKAIEAYRQSLDIYRQLGDSSGVADCSNNMGSVYKYIGNYESALEAYYRCLRIRENSKDSLKLASIYNNLGNFFSFQHKIAQALKYYQQCLEIQKRTGEERGLCRTYMNLGICHLDQDSLKTAFNFFKKSLRIANKLDDHVRIAQLHTNVGLYYENRRHYDSALYYYQRSIGYYHRIGDSYGQALAWHNTSNMLTKKERYLEALDYAQLGLDLSQEINYRNNTRKIYYLLTNIYMQLEIPKRAIANFENYTALSDSLYNEESAQKLSEMQAKYATQEKEQKIQLLQKDQELHLAQIDLRTSQRNAFIMTLIILTILASGIIIFYYQRQRALKLVATKNEELHRKRIDQLLKDQEMKSINAMIEGQEIERKRVAEDLHDRLGSMLSAIKLNFSAIEPQIHKGAAQQKMNDLLDKAVGEVREISHNMLSGVLTKFGLVPALNDLKGTVESSGQIEMKVIVHHLDDRLENQVELHLYRIVQELVSNALKHSRATEIVVQLTRHNGDLTLMVEDNGIGFNKTEIVKRSGMGIKNISSRVSKLGGIWNLDSSKGHGTTTTIEIPV